MGEIQGISKVTLATGLTSRTLRYWESKGLLKSIRDPVSGWRMYDEQALRHIRITALLRGLDISLKDIKQVLTSQTAQTLQGVLQKQQKKLAKMDRDLHKRAQALDVLINLLREDKPLPLPAMENLLQPVALLPEKETFLEEKGGITVENLSTTHDEVLVITLAPMRAAAYSVVGIEPEDKAREPVEKWIKEMGLEGTMRLFGFNVDPYPSEESPAYGFGYCATIPEGVEIPSPLYEMRMPGGLYAVISQYDGDPSFGWQKAVKLMEDPQWPWEYDMNRHPGLEEHIVKGEEKNEYFIPILLPVKKKEGK